MTVAASQPREDADVESSSERYARRFDGPVGRWFVDSQTRITLECLTGLPAGATILDVGGGHAQVAPPLVEAGYRVTVMGSDASCGERLEPLTSSGRCRFEVGDLQALPYGAEAFDAVVCYRLIAHSVDWRHLITELCRVARRRVIVDYPARRSVNVASQALFRLKNSIERGTTRPFALFDRAEIAGAFQEAGFAVTSVRPQFLLPMALYRLAGSVRLARAAESLARTLALTALLGSPVIARADRRLGSVNHPAADAPLRVLAWPGLGARAKNPYTWLLCSHLAALGVRVRDFTPARALRGGYDVLHIHWPEKALNAESIFGKVAGAAAALAILEAARLHGARVAWTTHNARPHESRHPKLEQWFRSAVVRRVDTVIHPSAAGQRAVEALYPELANRPHSVVPMGHFRGAYPDTISRQDARAGFGIPDGVRVVAFVGLVRPYKNVPHLIRTVRALPREAGEVVLLVGGAPHSAALAEEIRAAAGGDRRVRLALEHVPDDAIQRYLRAADLVVLPFRDITNSGSALLALSFDRPVLVPALGAMGELQALAGADWVRTYEKDLTPDLLAGALDWAVRRPPGAPGLDALEWPEIARQTLSAYRAGSR